MQTHTYATADTNAVYIMYTIVAMATEYKKCLVYAKAQQPRCLFECKYYCLILL